MQDMKDSHQMPGAVSLPLPPEKEPMSVPLSSNKKRVFERLLRTVRRYPIPLAVVIMLLVSLVLWLVGRGDVANWTLLAVVLMGGLPLLMGNWAAIAPQGIQC